jgi:hypothetical protein
MAEGTDCTEPLPVLGSITSAFGMALGELLLTLGCPDELCRCLSDIYTAAAGTILSSPVGWQVTASPAGDGV